MDLMTVVSEKMIVILNVNLRAYNSNDLPITSKVSSSVSGAKLVGLSTDLSKSGIVGTLSQTSSCNMIIKY